MMSKTYKQRGNDRKPVNKYDHQEGPDDLGQISSLRYEMLKKKQISTSHERKRPRI